LLLRSKHGRLLVWLPTYRDGSQYEKKGKYRNLRGFICPKTLPKTSVTVRQKEHNRRFFISFLPADNFAPVSQQKSQENDLLFLGHSFIHLT